MANSHLGLRAYCRPGHSEWGYEGAEPRRLARPYWRPISTVLGGARTSLSLSLQL